MGNIKYNHLMSSSMISIAQQQQQGENRSLRIPNDLTRQQKKVVVVVVFHQIYITSYM